MRVQNAIHGPNGTAIDAFIEQTGVDFGGREINEARFAQQIQNGLALITVQCAPRFYA